MSFDEIEKVDFETAEKMLLDYDVCKKLESDDPERFVELVSKLLEQGWLSIPFNSLSCRLKAEILERASSCRYPKKVKAEIVSKCIDGIFSSLYHAPYDSSLVNPTINAYNSLDHNEKEEVNKYISNHLQHKIGRYIDSHRWFYSVDRYSNKIYELEVYGWVKKLINKDFVDVMRQSIGVVGFQFHAPSMYPTLNCVAKKLGNTCPPYFYLSFDFSTQPLDIVRKKDSIPDADDNDSIPDSNEPRRRENRDLDIKPVCDYLGLFFYDACRGPHIVLRISRILDCATWLGITIVDLFHIVFIHEFAHLIHLTEEDSDGIVSTPSDSAFSELIAQLIAWHVIKGSPLQTAFEKLSNVQSPKYQSWKHMKKIPLEDLRSYLSVLRASNTPSTYAFARIKYPSLPVI